jgi:hypothetical protein
MLLREKSPFILIILQQMQQLYFKDLILRVYDDEKRIYRPHDNSQMPINKI